MLRTVLPLLLAVCLALLGGSFSADYALRHFNGFGKIQIGAWEAYPQVGADDADPYARAKAGRRAVVSLGRAEGLNFSLYHDEEGRQLTSRCRYILQGEVPEARFFTLYPVNQEHMPLPAAKAGLPDRLFSQDIIRDETGAMTLIVSPRAEDGNWLAAPQGDYGLQLTLYDTPIAAMTGQTKPSMPQVVKIKEGRCG